MSKTYVLGASLAATLVLGGVAVMAQDKAPADAGGPPKPAPELVEYMKDMVGNWTCATTFGPGAFGPGSPEVKTTSKVKISKEPSLGGMFYRGEYNVPKSKDVPMPFSGIFYLGYEPGSKQISNLSMDNTGTFSMALGPLTTTSASWTGDAYTMGHKAKARETMTKDGPKQVTHKYEVDMGKGFQLMGTDVCKK